VNVVSHLSPLVSHLLLRERESQKFSRVPPKMKVGSRQNTENQSSTHCRPLLGIATTKPENRTRKTEEEKKRRGEEEKQQRDRDRVGHW